MEKFGQTFRILRKMEKNLNISDVRSSKKIEVLIKVDSDKVDLNVKLDN